MTTAHRTAKELLVANRNILETTEGMGRARPDPVDHLHSVDHATENGIPIPARRLVLVIEERIVFEVNEKLAGRTVDDPRSGHGDRATQIAQAVGSFILDR